MAVLLLAGCGTGLSHADPARTHLVHVTAAENVWGSIAAQIGGSHVAVTSIITNPSTDPHTFGTTPDTAVAIGTADLVVENGLGYDPFVDRVLAADPQPKRRLLNVAAALGVAHRPDANPHLWYWTARLPEVAHAIAHELSALDPADAAAFRAGELRFDRSLQPLLQTIRQIRRRFAGSPVAYTERLPGYLLAAAGLRVVTPVGFAAALESGTDPSPQDVAAFDRQLTGHGAEVLIYNSQVVAPAAEHAKSLAQRSGVPVLGMSELLPAPHVSFQQWQLHQDRALLKALSR